jgi:hypothetical protein
LLGALIVIGVVALRHETLPEFSGGEAAAAAETAAIA